MTTPTRPLRRRPAPIRTTIERTTRISEHFVRVTVAGADLQRFRWSGPASHLKLMIPAPGADVLTLPEPDADGLVAFDRSTPRTMRTYTARSFDPLAGELDIDVFLHGTGPVSQWAQHARRGGTAAVSVPRAAGFVEDPDAEWVLLAGDASALPAIATIAPRLTKTATILIELADQADQAALDHSATWLTSSATSGAELARAIGELALPAGRGQVWVAAEAGAIRRIRSELLTRLGPERLTTRGYWRAGDADHPDHDYGTDD